MDNGTNPLTHPDFIWTWKESARGRRESLWIPYLQEVEAIPRSKRWLLRYNGGQIDTDLAHVDTILLYGASGSLPIEFVDALNAHRIVLLIHRRNQPRPSIFLPALSADDDDLLSRQILSRLDMRDAAYVSRTLIRERLSAFSWLSPVSATVKQQLAATRNVDEVRSIEATQSSRYWTAYFSQLDLPDVTRRENDHPVNAALDASSFFLHGILLRWILFHRLSPFHGFLHRPTGYTALVYDLLEPYRTWMEVCVAHAWKNHPQSDGENLTAHAIHNLKHYLEDPVYVPATMQTVRRKSLLHASVLSLRAWLIGKQTRFIVPVEGLRKGGRPVSVGFSIPGYAKNK